MVDKLLREVEEQFRKGDTPGVIKENLIRQGYSPALVDSVVESVMIKKSSAGEPSPLGVSHEKSAFSKIIFVLLFLGIVILGVIFLPDLLKGEKALLDITATPDRLSYTQGEELGFEVEIYNMGSVERFDITLIYRVLDENDITIISKEETIAISTSTSHYRTIKLPDSLRPGTYTLKAFANYEGRVAVSSFSFTIKEKLVPVSETCYDGVKNQDETGIDCGGVCGGYWYDNACHPTPKQEPWPKPEKASCNDGIKNQDEIGVDCGGVCGGYWYDGRCHSSPKPIIPKEPSFAQIMMNARASAKTNPEQAKNICLALEKSDEKDRCLKEIASISMKKEYCELIIGVNDRDACYYPFFMKGDYSVCEKLTNPQSKEACEQLRELSLIAAQLNQTTS